MAFASWRSSRMPRSTYLESVNEAVAKRRKDVFTYDKIRSSNTDSYTLLAELDYAWMTVRIDDLAMLE